MNNDDTNSIRVKVSPGLSFPSTPALGFACAGSLLWHDAMEEAVEEAEAETEREKEKRVMSSAKLRCENCTAFDGKLGGKWGVCRASLPALLSDPLSMNTAQWPHVKPHEWCCQFVTNDCAPTDSPEPSREIGELRKEVKRLRHAIECHRGRVDWDSHACERELWSVLGDSREGQP